MGIHNFQSFTRNVYKTAYKNCWLSSYDNLYFDINHILHHIVYTANSYDQILTKLKDYIVNSFSVTPATKTAIFVADGPAPLAKLIVQRKRRLDASRVIGSGCDNLSLMFSPGSEFMVNLERHLSDLIIYVKSTYNIEVIVDITGTGEGEIKIKSFVNKYQQSNPNYTHLIFSGDSDTILLLATCIDLNKLYMTLGWNDTISIGMLMNEHIKMFGITNEFKNDFVFVNLLMENDYVPKLGLVKLETIWNAYKNICSCFPDGLITRVDDNLLIDPIFFHELIYNTIKSSPRHLYVFNFDDVDEPHFRNYIDGLCWCFDMYDRGECIDHSYIFDHKISPHPWGVAFNIMFNNKFQPKTHEPIQMDIYAILITPKKVSEYLDQTKKQLYDAITNKFSLIYEEEICAECIKNHTDMLDVRCILNSVDDTTNKKEINSKKALINRRILNHKKQHQRLTLNYIRCIQQFYDGQLN